MNPYLMIFQREMTPIRKLLLMHLAAGGKLTEYTETGNPVSFLTNVAKPLSVLAAFSPVQAGSGDPSPDNVRPITGWSGAKVPRSGKNMFSYNADNVKQETTSSSTIRAVYHTGIFGDGSTKFTLSAYPKVAGQLTNANVNVGYFQNGIAYVVDYFIKTTEEATPTLKLSAGCELIIIYTADAVSGFKTNLVKYNIQIEIGNTATTFEEYAGQSVSVVFPATGKNLLNIEDTAKVVPGVSGSTITIENGVISIDAIAGSSRSYVVFNQKLPAGTYTIQAKVTGSVALARLLTSVEISGSAYNSFYQMYVRGIGENGLTFTLPSESYIGLNLNNAPGESGNPGSVYDIQIEKGETKTAYEPFTNTAYGGTIDLTTGVLTVTRGKLVLNSADMNSTNADYPGWKNCGIKALIGNTVNGIIGGYCDKAHDQSANTTGDNDTIYLRKDRNGLTQEEWIELATDVTFVVTLATPLVYQLTPTEILSLANKTNVLWSDLNGDLTVKYLKKG